MLDDHSDRAMVDGDHVTPRAASTGREVASGDRVALQHGGAHDAVDHEGGSGHGAGRGRLPAQSPGGEVGRRDAGAERKVATRDHDRVQLTERRVLMAERRDGTDDGRGGNRGNEECTDPKQDGTR